MKKYFFISVLLCGIIHFNAKAQFQQPQPPAYVQYTYDAAGNRILRQYFPFRTMGDTSKNDPKAVQIAQHYGVNVYPNPLMDGSNVTVAVSMPKENSAEQATIYVLNNNGDILFTQKQTTTSPAQIDLSSYASGVYYIKVAIGKEQLFYKVTKAK